LNDSVYDPSKYAGVGSGKTPQMITPDGEDLGPCASRPGTKWWAALHVHRGKRGTRAFQYANLGDGEFDPAGTSFIFDFHTPDHWRLTVTGRGLWPVFNYIAHHRLEWIRLADRDLAPDGQVIITGIVIEKIESEES